jgi:glycosyltransferase involved in cell wall biosynthesis
MDGPTKTRLTWAIITGEFPPQRGGVSDYTWLVSKGLAEAGDEVHVWAPSAQLREPPRPGISVHELPGHFGPLALARLARDFRKLPRPFRILVQYVPHAFGWKAMNLPFAAWLYTRRNERVWVMFHEVAFPLGRTQPLKHQLLGLITRAMAAVVVRAADRCFVSIPEWASMIRTLGASDEAIQLLPVPSNVPTHVDPPRALAFRARITSDPQALVVGHFGTFGLPVVRLLMEILPPLLTTNDRCVVALMGRGGREFARDFVKSHPRLAPRLFVTGGLASEDLATCLAACDLLVQPYPDGASSRNGSLMAGLGLGMPIVTTEGRLTETHWRTSGAVALAPVSSPDQVLALTQSLLSDPDAREMLRARAVQTYNKEFALENTLSALRESAII